MKSSIVPPYPLPTEDVIFYQSCHAIPLSINSIERYRNSRYFSQVSIFFKKTSMVSNIWYRYRPTLNMKLLFRTGISRPQSHSVENHPCNIFCSVPCIARHHCDIARVVLRHCFCLRHQLRFGDDI